MSRSAPLLLVLVVGLLAPATVTVAQAVDGSASNAVEGIVRGRDGERARPIAGAIVELRTGAGTRLAATDAGGRYRFVRAGPGEARLRVRAMGYGAMEVEVRIPRGGTITLDLELESQPVVLAPVRVSGSGAGPTGEAVPADGAQRGQLALRRLESAPGLAEPGLAALLQEHAGRPDDEPSAALLIRGAATEGKLVLLDGSPVYAPFHIGGLVPGFDTDLLGSTRFHIGGAPARYDGGLSYIMDLRTRAPRGDRLRSTGAADGLGARATVEGAPTSGVRVLAGGRALHGLQSRVVDGAAPPYGYADGLLRADLDLAPSHGLTATLFRNRESVRLDAVPRMVPDWSDGEPAPATARWGSAAVGTAYRGGWSGTAVELGGSASRYEASLPFQLSAPYLASAHLDRIRWHADLTRPWADGALQYGLSVDRHDVAFRVAPLEAGGGERPVVGQTRGWALAAYLEGNRPVAEELVFRAGLRGERFAGDGRVRIAPRISLAWLISESATLTVAAGRFHEYRSDPGLRSEAELRQAAERETWRPTLSVATASHVVVALAQEVSSTVRLDLDGFVKRFHGEDPDRPGIHTSGVELRAVREGDRFDAWLGYSLAWAWSARGIQPSSEFVGRHLIAAGVEGRVADRAVLAFTLEYGAGLPTTSIPLAVSEADAYQAGGVLSTGRSVEALAAPGGEGAPLLAAGVPEDFLRLDLEAYWTLNPRWRGRTIELRPYLRVLNALSRRDALFYHLDPWRDDEVRPLAERALLPLVGLEWRF